MGADAAQLVTAVVQTSHAVPNMKILKRFLGNSPQKPAPAEDVSAPAMLDGGEDSRMNDLSPQAATRRELLRVLTRDTLRYCGIPESWIECQVLVVSTRKGDTHLHARLVMRHWDELLLRHVVAFEQRFMAEVLRYEPKAAEWLHSITWQFKMPDCPNTEMPSSQSWGLVAASRPGALPVAVPLLDSEGGPGSDDGPEPVDEVQQDLARLFAVRDSALADLQADEHPPHDFAPTQPGAR